MGPCVRRRLDIFDHGFRIALPILRSTSAIVTTLTGPRPLPAWWRSAAPLHDVCDSAAHRSARENGRPLMARRVRQVVVRQRPARYVLVVVAEFRRECAGTARRDPNDGMGFVVGVASVVNLMQETRELVAIEPRPAAIQAGEEFELAACEYRHRKRRDAEAGDIGTIGARPLHLLHSGEVPAAVGADIDPALQALRFCGAAHLRRGPAVRWNCGGRRRHRRCRCGGSPAAAWPSGSDRSARRRTTGNICRSSCWLTPSSIPTAARWWKWRATGRWLSDFMATSSSWLYLLD